MMRIIKSAMASAVAGVLLFSLCGTVIAKDKFEKEVDKEKASVKLVREVLRGGYDVMTAEELKKLMDSGKGVRIIDRRFVPFIIFNFINMCPFGPFVAHRVNLVL